MRPDRRRSVIAEIGGGAAALGIAVIALTHLLGTDRGAFVLSSGDSVFLEFVWQSLRDGTSMHWSLSAVLFLFPELPIYLALRAPAELPQQAMIANALLSAVLLYALIRAIVRLLRPPAHSILVSLGVFAVLALCLLTESTSGYESFELVTFFFAGTFYYGTVLALFASVALVGLLIRGSSGWRDPRTALAAVALALIATLCTMSNPLYIVWAAAPLCAGLIIVAWRTPVTWLRAAAVAALMVVGAGVGMLLRLPFAQYASVVAEPYVHLDRSLEAFVFYLQRAATLLLTPLGIVEFLLLAGLCVAAVLTFVFSVRRGAAPIPLLVSAVGLFAPVIVFVFSTVLGTESARYLQPLYFAPLLSLAVLGTNLAARSSERAQRVSRPVRLVAAIGAVVLLVTGSVLSFGSLRAIATTPYERVQCLQDWVDGRDLTGVGQFWDTRDLQAYGDETVQILQVVPQLGAFPWLVDLSRYHDAELSYVVANPDWVPQVTALLGAPSAEIMCDSYVILDYAGTPGEAVLTSTVTDTAEWYAIEQGLK